MRTAEGQAIYITGAVRQIMDLHRRFPKGGFSCSKIITSSLQPSTESAAVGLLEQGVDVNVIRAWLGHVSLETTYRYAEITLRGKMAAVAACLPPVTTSIPSRRSDEWRKDEELLKWLDSL